MATTLPTSKPRVIVDKDGVLIRELRERDSELVTAVSEAADPEEAVRTCLEVGARAIRGVQVTLDAEVVETKFNEFEHKLEKAANRAVDQIRETNQHFLDPENGSLRKMIEEFDSSLADTFDPKSKASALSKLETMFVTVTQEQARIVRDLVDPGSPGSPLARLRGEIGRDLKEVRETLTNLQSQVAVKQTEAELLELTAVKGLRFEESVFEAAGAFVSMYGDQVDVVASEAGSDGGRAGDLLVRLSDEDSPAGPAAYVVEVKDRKMSLREAHAELERAMKNREVRAGVLVFSRQRNAPIRAPFKPFGNKAIVVLDKAAPDEQPLRLALMWAAPFSASSQHPPTAATSTAAWRSSIGGGGHLPPRPPSGGSIREQRSRSTALRGGSNSSSPRSMRSSGRLRPSSSDEAQGRLPLADRGSWMPRDPSARITVDA